MRLKELTEAKTLGGFLGTVSNTISLGKIGYPEAERIEMLLRRPEIGWHTTAFKNGSEWFLKLTVNVERDNLE